MDARNSAISMDSVETSTGRNEGRITRREQHDNDNDNKKNSNSINDNAIEVNSRKDTRYDDKASLRSLRQEGRDIRDSMHLVG